MEGPIINFLYAHIDVFNTIGVLIVFVSCFLESTPFFGLISPAQTILLIGGFLTSLTGDNFCGILAAAIVGSILGDLASFFAGRKYGPGLLTRYGSKFLIKREYIEKVQTLLDEHLGKTLFIGRLNSISRSMAPFLAGSSKVKFSRFIIWVIAGSALWSFVFIGIGRVFAESFDLLGPAIGKFIFSAIVVFLGLLAILIYLRKKHFFITNKHISLIILCVLSLFTFGIIGQNVLENGQFKEVDVMIEPMIENLRSDVLTPIMIFFTELGDEVALTLITICTALILFLKRRRVEALLMCSTVFCGAILVYLIKAAVGSARPLGGLIRETTFSFPSGHASLTIIFALTLAYIIIKKEHKEGHIWCIVFCALLFPLIVGFSRLYLGVHWTSDVMGGYTLGIFVTTIVILLFDFMPWLYHKIKTRQITPNL